MTWNEFEVKHGNEDTFREMLRIKRSVSASYSQTHFNTVVANQGAPSAPVVADASAEQPKRMRYEDEDTMAMLEVG